MASSIRAAIILSGPGSAKNAGFMSELTMAPISLVYALDRGKRSVIVSVLFGVSPCVPFLFSGGGRALSPRATARRIRRRISLLLALRDFFASSGLPPRGSLPGDGHLPRERVARAGGRSSDRSFGRSLGPLFIFSSPINLAGGSVAWPRTKTKQSRSGICGGELPARLISEYCAGTGSRERCARAHSLARADAHGAPWVRYRVTRSYSVFGARRVNDAIATQCQSDRITDTIPTYSHRVTAGRRIQRPIFL